MNAKEFFNEVANMIKAIGTSSSANEERDERSVENYVRQSANVNTQIGGNTIVSNTTEPDPQGEIAVQKSFPTGGEKLIAQETRPTDGATSVADAPNEPGVVPNNETFPGEGSAVAPSRQDEMQNATKVTKSTTCPDCGHNMIHECMGKADAAPADAAEITKAADEVESKEEDAKETAADEAKEMKKSLWGGAFSPIK